MKIILIILAIISINFIPSKETTYIRKAEAKEILRAIKNAHTPLYAKESKVVKQINSETDLEALENFDVQAAWDAA